MSDDTHTRANPPPGDGFRSSWRFRTGLGLIVLGHLALLLGLLSPFLGLGGAGLAGALVVGGELVSLASIVFLGKSGFLAIKNAAFGFVKKGYAGPVSLARHIAGILLFVTNWLTLYVMALYAWVSFEGASPESPIPVVFGMGIQEQGNALLAVFLVGELTFLLSIYVLGADWWERFRNVFVWHRPGPAPVQE